MKLKEFIEEYIEHNSLIRLVYKEKGGHKLVMNKWDDVSMEWEVLKGEGVYKNYINYNVLGVTDILVNGAYSEAINIVIKNYNNRKDKLKKILKNIKL